MSADEDLWEAVANGHVAVVAALLDRGASVGASRPGERSTLHEAARRGHLEVARLLLRRGAAVDAVDRVGNDRTPLHEAVGAGDTSLIELLLVYGASIGHRNVWGATPLHLAARLGDVVDLGPRATLRARDRGRATRSTRQVAVPAAVPAGSLQVRRR